METIPQEKGGGWRYVFEIQKNDGYNEVFQKIKNIYFPSK